MSAANLRMNNKRNQYHLICRVISICLCALFCLSFGCTSKKDSPRKRPDPRLTVSSRASPSASSLQATINRFLRNPTARPSALSCAAFWPSCSRLLFCSESRWVSSPSCWPAKPLSRRAGTVRRPVARCAASSASCFRCWRSSCTWLSGLACSPSWSVRPTNTIARTRWKVPTCRPSRRATSRWKRRRLRSSTC